MSGLDFKKILLKNLWWLGIILIAAIWFRLDFNFNSAFPLENATILKGNLVLSSEGSSLIHDNYSLPVFTTIFSIGSSFGSLLGARITSLFLSLFMLFFFYKFANRLFNDKLASAFSVIFLAVQAPIIFLGKFASNDILSLALFSAFLMVMSEILTSDDKSGKIQFINISKQLFCPIAASILFVLAAFSNYVVFLYLIPTLLFFLIKDKKTGVYFVFSTIILSFFIYLLNFEIINYQISTIININNENFKTMKLLVRIAEYIAFPLMLTYATLQILWKTELKVSLVYTFIASSLIIPLYIIISYDVFNIYRLIPFSLILLSPFCGIIISKFILINPSYKYATIFAMYFIVAVSYWNLTKLEMSYPNTDTIVNYCSEYFDKNTTVYCEDPYLISNSFYPSINIQNFRSIYYMDSNNKSFVQRKENIINQIENGMINYVILNGLFHSDFTEQLKEKHLKGKYLRIMSQEFTCNTLMYPTNEGSFDIYRIKPEYKYIRKFLSKRE
ncbi:MAG: hypothetical protein V1779_01890 [bacterium]